LIKLLDERYIIDKVELNLNLNLVNWFARN
jgi:hypothetical protein